MKKYSFTFKSLNIGKSNLQKPTIDVNRRDEKYDIRKMNEIGPRRRFQ